MKRLIAILLAVCLVLSLAACGKDKPKENELPKVEAPEAPFVEETPPANKLDGNAPIPADTGTLELSPVTFEDANLILNLPEGVTATEQAGTDNNASIAVTSDDGVWKLTFEPYKDGRNLLSFTTTTMYYGEQSIKQDWSQDVKTTLDDFPARVWANNILAGWLQPTNWQDTPAVDVIVDYGETLVGPWYGMHIRLEAQNPTDDTNIYDLLYLRHVRAVLHNFEVIRTPDGVTKSAGGITATFPARWRVLVGDTGIVTGFNSETVSGGINFGTVGTADPAVAAENWGGEQFTYDVAGRTFHCALQTKGEDEDSLYFNLSMFSEFSDSRCLQLFLNLRGFTPEDYLDYLESDTFVDVVASMEIDPNGYRKPGTASANGFETDRGFITGYTGDATKLEIPAEIGGMDTVAISRGAFANNTDITHVVIPEGVLLLEGSAFEGCTNLQTVELPSSLMEIEGFVFDGCTSLRDVVLPEGVAYVGTSAFRNAGVGSFSGSGAEYGHQCFKESTFESLSFANGADLSADFMFADSFVTEVNLPADLTALGQGAFSGCRPLDELVLPDSLTTLGVNCFTNMGYLQIELSEALEVIPDSAFSSTSLDVLVVPAGVRSMEAYAIYDAACVILESPETVLAPNAIDCDVLYITDADQFVFPEEMVFWVQTLHLDGVYDPAQIQGSLSAQGVERCVYLPMDATMDEAAAMDAYLGGIGFGEIAWIGTDRDFLPERTAAYTVDGYLVTDFAGGSMISIPDYVMLYDDPFWYTTMVGGAAEEAFAGCEATVAYIRSNMGDCRARFLAGCDKLTDLWFSGAIVDEISCGYFDAEAFAGIPDGVTVHIPEGLEGAEEALHSCGLPDTAVFATYTLR